MTCRPCEAATTARNQASRVPKKTKPPSHPIANSFKSSNRSGDRSCAGSATQRSNATARAEDRVMSGERRFMQHS